MYTFSWTLEKAFDAINHDTLLTMLEKYGNSQKEMKWCTS